MPRLVIRVGAGMGRDHALGAAPCIVGRGPGADFTLEDAGASRQHFRVVGGTGMWVLEDLGSTNGTYVNGHRAKRARLRDGDVVRVGTTEIAYVQKDMLPESAQPGAAAAPGPIRRKRLR